MHGVHGWHIDLVERLALFDKLADMAEVEKQARIKALQVFRCGDIGVPWHFTMSDQTGNLVGSGGYERSTHYCFFQAPIDIVQQAVEAKTEEIALRSKLESFGIFAGEENGRTRAVSIIELRKAVAVEEDRLNQDSARTDRIQQDRKRLADAATSTINTSMAQSIKETKFPPTFGTLNSDQDMSQSLSAEEMKKVLLDNFVSVTTDSHLPETMITEISNILNKGTTTDATYLHKGKARRPGALRKRAEEKERLLRNGSEAKGEGDDEQNCECFLFFLFFCFSNCCSFNELHSLPLHCFIVCFVSSLRQVGRGVVES